MQLQEDCAEPQSTFLKVLWGDGMEQDPCGKTRERHRGVGISGGRLIHTHMAGTSPVGSSIKGVAPLEVRPASHTPPAVLGYPLWEQCPPHSEDQAASLVLNPTLEQTALGPCRLCQP